MFPDLDASIAGKEMSSSFIHTLFLTKLLVPQQKFDTYQYDFFMISLKFVKGNAVGLLLPPEVTEDQRCGFELLLNQLTDANIQTKENLSEYDEYIKVGEIIMMVKNLLQNIVK